MFDAVSDDRLAKSLPLRPLSSDVSSKESFNVISTWLQQCLSNHKECQNRDNVERKLPTRVIDVQHESEDPFLLETNQNWQLGFIELLLGLFTYNSNNETKPPTALQKNTSVCSSSNLERGLLWQRSDNSGLPLIRHAEYIAPSWNWASVSASHMSTRRIYDNLDGDDNNMKDQLDAKIIEIIICNENDDHFGIVHKGHVKLSGPTLEVCGHEIPSIFWDCPEDAAPDYAARRAHFESEGRPYHYTYNQFVREWNLITNECNASHSKVLLVNI
ncbi:predicted protein [Botrytis cinerea T4]|uniref:Uncharacterized protein n=1 Tax=Botryotinia fuckeliana (strain T4) TaxID=999810 RepID=G2YKE6_BOTF4|nr:predicted protein [Botrytis cinerea T4]